MIVGDLDLGGSHPWPAPSGGQVIGAALIEGSGTTIWPRGGTERKQDVFFGVSAWQGLGGGGAGGFQALRYLLQQLRELALNPDFQPVYIRWTATAQSGQYNVADLDDGWYVIENLQPDYQHNVVAGFVTCRATVSLAAPASPASLALWWSGALLGTTFTGGTPPAGIVLGAYPVGSTAPGVGVVFSRTGAEGVIPISGNIPAFTPNPLPFVRPSTIAGLYTGGCRVLDTVVAGGNAVPTNGTFLHANWVQVYGTAHDFTGDIVVTNGLLLLLFQPGQPGVQVWLWNTKLSTPAWQQAATMRYLDSVPAAGTLREVTLERVGMEQVRLRAAFSTAGGQWGRHDWWLRRGHYHASFDFWPRTLANSINFGVDLQLSAAAKIAYNDGACVDLVNPTGGSLAPVTTFGHATVVVTGANSPLVGLLYQNPPSAQQPALSSTTEVGGGDASGPALGTFRSYGVFATPFPNAPGLQAEAESGVLGTGWSSVGNVNASGGNEAKAASGTAAGNNDTFGSWTVPAGFAAASVDVFFRVRVTSNAGAAVEMTLGLWDATAGAFVGSGSTTYRANQAQTTYNANNWLRVNQSGMNLPPIGHVLQFRALTALALGTDWFIDEAFIAPRTSAPPGNIGQGDWPADIWAQFMFPLTNEWVPA